MTATASAPAPRRAIWGLVNDGYALVAKTANLTHDEAFELCRVPDIGDPSAYLDQGVAYLRSPKWGHVLARYFTNAERDSAGRASLVYDVVALSDADFAAIGCDAFRALPPLSTDRRPERLGELPAPLVPARDEAAEAVRLDQLITREDSRAVATLLGALLAGDRVLCVGATVRPETIECITLLLPPVLRPLVTFQVPTVDYPKHTPRLTVAERGHALLLEREWSAILPRDADDPALHDAIANAGRLVALGRMPDRLRSVWVGVDGGVSDLADGVARMLRLDLLNEGLRSGDVRRAVLVPARAEQWDERRRLTNTLFEHETAERVAAGLADVIRGDQRGAWAAAHAIGACIGHDRESHPARFRELFTRLVDHLRDVPVPTTDLTPQSVRVMLACGAASLGDLDRFLAVADPSLPWELAWNDGCARWVKGRSHVARLFDALAAKGATYGEALDGMQAITQITSDANGTNHRTRGHASAIAFALVRRVLRERATLEPPDRLGALVESLVRLWTAPSASKGPTTSPTDPVERAVRRFLGLSETPASGTDARRTAADLSRVFGESADATGDTELGGWVIAALERAHAGALSDAPVRATAALLEDLKRLAPRNELASQVGQVLLHFAAADAAFVFRPAWLDVARQVDDMSRRELLTRALAWVARGYAGGRFTVGAFVDACALAGGEGGRIDDATVELLVPQLATAAASRDSTTELAILA
ncbi:MAG TPA: hypothetical protein VFZ21_03085, partial [Gemmatimonadaceae bacterium]|nr:hypothetical protein [Gemmatimonadaceae bacterium]